MNQNILEIHHLSKDYGTFRFGGRLLLPAPGRHHGPHRENGAGKSTTINCILGEVQKSGGEITLFGQAQTASEKRTRTGSGWCLTKTTFRTSSPPRSWAR